MCSEPNTTTLLTTGLGSLGFLTPTSGISGEEKLDTTAAGTGKVISFVDECDLSPYEREDSASFFVLIQQ